MESFDPRLTEHPLTRRVFKEGLAIQQAVLPSDQALKVNPEYARELDEYEFYVGRASFYLVHLLTLCDQVRHVPLYMTSFSPSKRMRSAGITRFSHLLFHIESFFIRVSSLEDRVLQFVDSVFHLGNDPRDSKYQSMIRNVHVKVTPIPGVLKELHKLVNTHVPTRNLIIHQETYQDNELRYLNMLAIVSGDPELPGIPQMFRTKAQDIARSRIEEFERFASQLFEVIANLFDVLEPVWAANSERLLDTCGYNGSWIDRSQPSVEQG